MYLCSGTDSVSFKHISNSEGPKVTHRNGHGGGSGDIGTAHRVADGKFILTWTDGIADLKAVNCGERPD